MTRRVDPAPQHEQSVALTCHPTTPAAAVRDIAVRVWRSAAGVLTLAFQIDGDLEQLRVPPPRPARIAHRLWQHTCCEAFVAVKGATAYHELNFAPSGEWAAYAFSGYREGTPLEDQALAPGIAVRQGGRGLTLDALVPLAHLSPSYARAALRLGLSAVIEARDGTRSYWALRHPPGPPDFHHQDAFALRLPPPPEEC